MKSSLILISILLLSVISNAQSVNHRRVDTVRVRRLLTPIKEVSIPNRGRTATYLLCIDKGGDNFSYENEYYAILSEKGEIMSENIFVIKGNYYKGWNSDDNNDVYRIISEILSIPIDAETIVNLISQRGGLSR